MLTLIWNTLTRKPLSTQSLELEPVVKYRMAMYLTATPSRGLTETSVRTSGTIFRKFGTTGSN